MVQHFYVLYNKEKSAFYVEDPEGFALFSTDLLWSKHYHTEKEAINVLKTLEETECWTVKKATISIEL